MFYVYSQIRALRRNIAAAKSSGFPYVVVPLIFASTPWELPQRSRALLPLQILFFLVADRLPESWTRRWLP